MHLHHTYTSPALFWSQPEAPPSTLPTGGSRRDTDVPPALTQGPCPALWGQAAKQKPSTALEKTGQDNRQAPCKTWPQPREGGTKCQRGSENQTGVPVSAGPGPQPAAHSARHPRSCWNADTRAAIGPRVGQLQQIKTLFPPPVNQGTHGGAHHPVEAEALLSTQTAEGEIKG